MKFKTMSKAALVLALGVMTSTVLALDYKESFEQLLVDGLAQYINVPGGITNAPNWYSGPNEQSYVTNNVTYALDGGISGPISGANTHALRLNTEGETLTNTFNTAETSFQYEPIWLDTVVQFVTSEDLPSGLADDNKIKLALYALAGETSTNLAVYHGTFDDGLFGNTNTVTDIAIDPEKWYRVTVELRADEGPFEWSEEAQAFSIKINGQLVEVSENAYGSDWMDMVDSDTPPAGGSWFLSAGRYGGEPTVIEALAFQGTGYIDDLCLVATDPFYSPPTGEGFLITQTVGANGWANPADVEIQIAVGGSTSIVYTASDWYRIQALTVNGSDVVEAAGERSYEWTVTEADDDYEIDVSFTQTGSYGSESLSQDVLDWLTTNQYGEDNITWLDTLAMAHLLDVDPTAAETFSFAIESIVVDSDVNVKVKLLVDGQGHQSINGALVLYSRASLTEGEWVATDQVVIPGPEVFDANGEKVFTFQDAAANKFYKAVIEAYVEE